MKTLLAGLLLCAAAAAQSPLAIFAPLVDGQWVSSSKLPNGQEVRNRTVWTWGAGNRVVRMRQFVLGDEGEVQRYETIVAYDGAKEKIVYLVFSEAGLLARGTARRGMEGIVLEQPALESFPAMRTVYAVRKDDTCAVRISFKGEEGWKQRMESTLRRTKIGVYKPLDLERGKNPLEPLADFVGSWEHRTTEKGSVKAVTVGEWSLHNRLLRFVDSWQQRRGLEPFWERYVSFDAKTGKALVFLVGESGDFVEGTVTKERDLVTWHFAGTNAAGDAMQVKFHCKFADLTRQAWTSEELSKGKWVPTLFGNWFSRRRP